MRVNYISAGKCGFPRGREYVRQTLSGKVWAKVEALGGCLITEHKHVVAAAPQGSSEPSYMGADPARGLRNNKSDLQ